MNKPAYGASFFRDCAREFCNKKELEIFMAALLKNMGVPGGEGYLDMNNSTLKPGAPDAVAAGCTCPILDNHNGRGYMGQTDVYAMEQNCPIHGTNKIYPQDKKPNDSCTSTN